MLKFGYITIVQEVTSVSAWTRIMTVCNEM